MPWTKARRAIRASAQKQANQQPMSYHADGCPFLISAGRQSCECNCMSFVENRLLDEARKSGAVLFE